MRLTLHNVSLGESTICTSEPDPHTGRPRCVQEVGSREARLVLYEAPWRDVKLPRACLCDNTSHLPLTHISSSRALEITFLIEQQAPHEDFETLFFYASFELVRAPECPRKQRVRGEGCYFTTQFINVQKTCTKLYIIFMSISNLKILFYR